MPASSPVLVAPTAQQVAAHPDDEGETGAAVAARGSILGVSTNTAVPFDRIAATGARWWFQDYPLPDRGVTRAPVERAAAAGAEAIILRPVWWALAAGGAAAVEAELDRL